MIALLGRIVVLFALITAVTFVWQKTFIKITHPMNVVIAAAEEQKSRRYFAEIEIAELTFHRLEDYGDLYDRQVFFRGRKFVDPGGIQTKAPEPAPVPEPVREVEFRILGIWKQANDERVLLETDNSPAKWYVVGDTLEDHKLVSIDEESIVLAVNSRERKVLVYTPLQ